MTRLTQDSIYKATPSRCFAALSILSLAAMLVSGCSDRRKQGTETGDVSETPKTIAGKRVTLIGEVGDVPDEQSFILEGNDWIFDDKVLVLSKSPMRLGAGVPVEEADVVVTGKVRKFARADVEKELGHPIPPEIAGKWEGKPVIVAETIESVGRGARWSADEGATKVLTIWAVYTTPRPEALAGSEIELSNVTVRSKAGKGMWVGFRQGAQIFTVPSDAKVLQGIEVGSQVDVKGKLRVVPPANQAMKEWGMNKGLARQLGQQALYISDAKIEKAGARTARTGTRP